MMMIAPAKTKPDKERLSAPEMMSWQYKNILATLGQIGLHASDDSCPCNQVHLGDDGKYNAEYCLAKHLIDFWSLSLETSLMDPVNRDMLEDMASEANEFIDKAKVIYCKGGTWPDLARWARDSRKKIEPIYYSCSVAKPKAVPAPVPKLNKSTHNQVIPHGPPAPAPVAVKITGKCTDGSCHLKVKATDQTEETVASLADLAATVDRVLERHSGKRQLTPSTFAFGTTGLVKYEFRYVVKESSDLIPSHNPYTFEPTPGYPQELQPRLRGRAATQNQVNTMAANLDPGVLLSDFQSLDRGAPIIGPDNVVESGNGRVMAIIKASVDYPEIYAQYRDELIEKGPTIGISVEAIEKLKIPVLVRERVTKVDRKDFVEEANASTTMESSSIEKARTDAEKITPSMLYDLQVSDSEGIGDALRASKNKTFTSRFLMKLPQNEQARLLDAKGILNQDGVRRVVLAVFVSAFAGDAGLQLAERFFDSTDANVRNVFNGIGASLGLLAKMEALTRSGAREAEFSISDDLARAVSVFSAIRKTPSLTVEKYLAQHQLFERELTDFQERILSVLYENSKSSKKIGTILKNYAALVIEMPPPHQGSLMELERPDKAILFDQAVSAMAQDREIATEALVPAPAPAHIPKELSSCKVIKTHDDGDLSLKCPQGEYVVTTEGQVFREEKPNKLKSVVCKGITEARQTHVHFLALPPDEKTGDHNWHNRWIHLYDKTLDYCGCGVPAPPKMSQLKIPKAERGKPEGGLQLDIYGVKHPYLPGVTDSGKYGRCVQRCDVRYPAPAPCPGWYHSPPAPAPATTAEIMARLPRTDQIGSTMEPIVEIVSDIGGFEQTLSKMNRAKALEQMNMKKMIAGKGQSRKEYIEDSVAKGAIVGVKEGRPALVFPDGSYMRQSEITKTALDYANYLLDPPAPAQSKGQGEVKISGQCTDGSCHLKVEAIDKIVETVASLKGLPATVDRVLKEHSTKSQSPAPAPSLNKTPISLDAPAPPEGHSKKTVVCRSSLKHAHSLK